MPRRRVVRVISGTIVTLAVGAASVFATRSAGEPVHDVALTDGGVWVTSGTTGMWGRVNRGAHSLDRIIDGAGTGPATVPLDQKLNLARADVLQDGPLVVGVTGSPGGTARSLVPIDPRTGRPSERRGSLPAPVYDTGEDVYRPTVVDLRGGTIAMTEPSTGQIWAKRLAPGVVPDLADFTPQREPIAVLGKNTAIAVDLDGNVKAVSAQTGKVVDIPVEGDGFGQPEERTLTLGGRLADITAVGDLWVVVDLSDGQIWSEGEDKPSQVGGGGSEGGLLKVALQAPGPPATSVAYSTVTEMAFAGLGGSSSQERGKIVFGEPSKGVPPRFVKVSRPVVNGRCVFGVRGHASVISYQVLCTPDEIPAIQITFGANPQRHSGVALRLNRGQVLLNDLDTGRVYDLALGTTDPRVDTWPATASATTSTKPSKKK